MSNRFLRFSSCMMFGTALVALPKPVIADTLADAIALAYRSNPTLQQGRADQRALDENYVQAASGLRPTVQLQVIPQYQDQRYGALTIAQERQFSAQAATHQESNNFVGQVVVTQPLYTGGRVAANISTSRSQIAAGKQQLRSAEGDLLLNVVNAYTSVRRDLEIMHAHQAALDAFQHQVDEAQARRAAGDATVTDVEQAQAERDNERALYASAQQQLQASRALYFSVVGENPGVLEPEPTLPNMPSTVDEAFDRAEAASPELKQAEFNEAASRAQIAAARSNYMPNVSLQASYGDTVDLPAFLHNITTVFTAQAVVTMPLYYGGLNASNVRKAIEQNEADRSAVEIARRQAVMNVANAWNGWLTAKQSLELQEKQVTAAQGAYYGMQQEYRAGLRSSFDVIYAEETLLNAQVLMLEARHDAYYYQAAVLRYTGSLEVGAITSGVPLYDPSRHEKRVEHAFAPPWDPILVGIDSVLAPGPIKKALTAPALANTPIIRSGPEASASQPLASNLPTTPLPGTTAH